MLKNLNVSNFSENFNFVINEIKLIMDEISFVYLNVKSYSWENIKHWFL